MHRICAAVCLLLTCAAASFAGALRVGPDGRYFIDSATKAAFFWLGNTQWALFRGYSIDEARIIVDSVKSKGP